MLVVQVVEILWTKATRGAPRSKERQVLPRAFPVEGAAGGCVIQRYRMAEWEAFSPKLVKFEQAPSIPGSVDVLRISSEPDGAFTLGILGTPNSGQPPRRAIEKAVSLSLGEYARLTVNARHTSYSGQYYTETVYNVACGDKIPGNRFLMGPPEHDLNLKANLF